MSSKYVVYMHVNKINNMIYIGQTCQNPPSRRWGINGNGYKRNKKFYSAILKYGWDNFKHIILKDNLTLEEANYYEELYIRKYHSYERNLGYNLQYGGKSKKPTQETIKKLKQSHLGYIQSQEQKNKNRLNNIGKHNRLHTEEEKKKMSEAKKKRVVCLNTGEIFDSIGTAAKWCGLKSLSGISAVCKNKRSTAGKHPITNEPLKWKFFEEEH